MNLVLIFFVKATVLLALCLLATWSLNRFNPRWRILVCEAGAGALLLLPLAMSVPFTLPIAVIPARTDEGPVSEAAPLVLGETVAVLGQKIEVASPVVEIALPVAGEGLPAVFPPSNSGLSPRSLAWLGLGLFSGAGLFVWFRRYRRCRVQLRQWIGGLSPADGASRSVFRDLVRDMGIKQRVRLAVSRGDHSPFCCGWRRCTVVIPQSLTDSESASTLRMVLRHELSHVANHDMLRRQVMNAVTAVFWFHPLVWLLRRSHLYAIEELGDRVAAGSHHGRESYRRALAQLTLGMQASPVPSPVVLGVFGPPQIVVRLRRLRLDLAYGPLRRGTRSMFLIGIVAPVLLALAMAQLVEVKLREPAEAVSRGWIAGLAEEQQVSARETLGQAMSALRRLQAEDGSVPRQSSDLTRERESGFESGVTALAGMAFLARGGAGEKSPNHKPMLRSLRYVLKCQAESGWFRGAAAGNAGSIYHHAIAVWFLASAHGHLTGALKEQVAQALPRAVERLVDAQGVPKIASHRGGWRYAMNSRDSDLSCTAWAVRALIAAQRVDRVGVPREVFEDALAYVKRLQRADGGFMYVAGSEGMPSNVARSAMGLYCFQSFGEGDSESADRAAQYMVRESQKSQKTDAFYGALWGAAAMWPRQGELQSDYAAWLVGHLQSTQRRGRWPSQYGDVLGTIFGVLALVPPESLTPVVVPPEDGEAGQPQTYNERTYDEWNEMLSVNGMRKEMLPALRTLGYGADAEIAEEAIPMLLALVRNGFPATQCRCMGALRKLENPSDQVLEVMMEKLGGPLRGIRTRAAYFLGHYPERSSYTVPRLVRLLQEDNTFAHRSAVFALERLGPAAKDALPALRNLRATATEPLRKSIDDALAALAAE